MTSSATTNRPLVELMAKVAAGVEADVDAVAVADVSVVVDQTTRAREVSLRRPHFCGASPSGGSAVGRPP